MKNKLIEQKLNQYAEAVKPGNAILEPAVSELRQRRQWNYGAYAPPYPAAPRKRRLSAGIWAAAACAFVLTLSLTVYFSYFYNKNAPEPMAYNLSELTYRVEPIAEIERTSQILIINIDENFYADYYTNCRVYSNAKGEPLVISVLYKTVGGGGLDEVVVIADLSGGLKDYKGFKALTEIKIGGVTVNRRQTRENGEYYSDAYFSYGGIDYYVIISSPAANGAERYVELLLGKT